MLPYLIDWLSVLGRWLHFITGIAWIGSSFYFVWLDNHLLPVKLPEDDEKGVGGEVWSVHGGGFYHAQKYRVAPHQLPQPLHWFKWEAYTTWMSGMFLLALVYWYGAEIYLIDPQVLPLSPLTAVGAAVGCLVASWLVYDFVCKSKIGENDTILALTLLVLVTLLAWGLSQLFSGRGAYIHFGAALGTVMVANVFFVIIPGQKQMVDAAALGNPPDPYHGVKAKQRSVHNTYFTLPVLFVMISNHYAMTYAHKYSWLILVVISVAGALIRIYFVARHKGRASVLPLVVAVMMLLGCVFALTPIRGPVTQSSVSDADIHKLMQTRCTTCHSDVPTFTGYPTAPGGVVLDNVTQILAAAPRIHQQTVLTSVMPIGNLTQMTQDERMLIDAWYQALQRDDTKVGSGTNGK